MLSVPLIALFPPWVSVVVVAELLPEPRLVLKQQVDPVDPLSRLPEVQVRHEQPGRSAVFGGKLSAVELEGNPRLAVEKVFERKVGRVTAVAVDEGEVAQRCRHQRGDGRAKPLARWCPTATIA